ncbi:MAG: hypothetical protein ACI9MJ_002385 [Alphaproteobacteria bacterium]
MPPVGGTQREAQCSGSRRLFRLPQDFKPKTVEVHRSHVMDKMDVASLANLVQIIATFDDSQRTR